MFVILTIMFVASVIILIASVLMSADSQGFSGALVGASDLELFKFSKEKKGKKVLKWLMFILGITLMISTIIIRSLM